MRTLKSAILLCVVVVAIAGVSCEKTVGTDSTRAPDRTDTTHIDSGVEMDMVDRSYSIYLSFVDTEGNDLVVGICATDAHGFPDSGFADQYTLRSSPNRKEMWSWEGSFPQSMGYTPVDPWETPDLYPSLGLITPDSKSEWLWDEEHWRTVSPTEEEYNKHMQNSYNTWKGYRNAINGLYHLSFRMSSPPWYGSLVLETITYTLTCPHVFGDDTAHEIATYWEAPSSGNLAYGVCSKIVFDGEEISDLVFTGGESIAFATIVLDR